MNANRKVRSLPRCGLMAAIVLVLQLVCTIDVAKAQTLESYNVRINETSVSGISSGAFMAVQFAVAHSAIIKGVGATAGGPWFCADTLLSREFSARKVLAHCMQGDPAFPAIPITEADSRGFITEVEKRADADAIDPTSNLANQKVWLFHGYNDGIVKKPVSDALYAFYSHFNKNGVFYKDNLPAGHAQVIDYCPFDAARNGTVHDCDCRHTGDNFIKDCSYDSAGAMLQHFYGELKEKTSPPKQKLKTFSQNEFALDASGQPSATHISMGKTGYLYVPASCAAMKPCRVHIALHGCLQSSDQIGDDFVRYAGFNEWADANDIIVLYPQAAPSQFPQPNNPQGCWDWWGYNQESDSKGTYATKAGLQVAAIMRMLERVAGGRRTTATPVAMTTSPLAVTDFSHRQVALRWGTVPGATRYIVYRSTSSQGTFVRANADDPIDAGVFVDANLTPNTTYFYKLSSIDSAGREVAQSGLVKVSTAAAPPRCDPYFSLASGQAVTKAGVPTGQTCP